MPVAKSYKDAKIVSDIYMKNGRQYVKIEMPGSFEKPEKEVRWYSDYEYTKMYGEEPMKRIKTEKEVLGFTGDFITIFYGNTYPYKEWFKEIGGRYHKRWGWFLPTGTEIPEDLPTEVRTATVTWDMVGNEDGSLKNDDLIEQAISALIYEPSDSEFVGEIGERIELYVTIERAIMLQGYYGTSTLFIMTGDDGNTYTWTTASKDWEVGEVHHIRGTVKDHTIYRNTKQTVLTRCSEVREK